MKKQWIKALRSGKYKQGNRKLNRDDYYCCLGVLAAELGILRKTHSSAGYVFTSGGTSEAYLDSNILPNNCQEKLSYLNDCEEKSFSEIADYLEQTLRNDWEPNVLRNQS